MMALDARLPPLVRNGRLASPALAFRTQLTHQSRFRRVINSATFFLYTQVSVAVQSSDEASAGDGNRSSRPSGQELRRSTEMSMRCMGLMLMTAASMGSAHAWDSYEHSEVGDAAFLLAIAALDTDAPGTSAKLLSQPPLASAVDVAFRSAPLLMVRKSQITKMKLCNS